MGNPLTAYPYTPQSDDPFSGGTKVQSLSWRGLPVGSEFTLTVLEPAKLLHSRDFETNLPAYWNNDPTQPKMSAVLNVRVVEGPHSVGEERSIWALKAQQSLCRHCRGAENGWVPRSRRAARYASSLLAKFLTRTSAIAPLSSTRHGMSHLSRVTPLAPATRR